MGSQEANEPDGQRTLNYRVPHGQDPVAVLTALTDAGYHVRHGEFPDTNVIVTMSDEADDDREDVRSVIAEVHSTQVDGAANFDPHPVQFTDETPS